MTVRALSLGEIGGGRRKDDRASAISVGKSGIDRGEAWGCGCLVRASREVTNAAYLMPRTEPTHRKLLGIR